MPLAMFVAGGFASTGGLVPITRGGSLTLLRSLASPNRDRIHPDGVDTLLREATRARDARLIAGSYAAAHERRVREDARLSQRRARRALPRDRRRAAAAPSDARAERAWPTRRPACSR